MHGSCNDISVLNNSNLLHKISTEKYPPPMEYEISGTRRHIPYWLVDGIYPKKPFFLHTFPDPITKKEKVLAESQEFARKDVESAFAVLQRKWHIISTPGQFFSKAVIGDIVKCCVILHNMAAEERDVDEDGDIYNQEYSVGVIVGYNAVPICGTLKPSGSGFIPPVGILAALCEVNAFTGNHAGYWNTKPLVMDHILEAFGSYTL